jgi:hypothetical protein
MKIKILLLFAIIVAANCSCTAQKNSPCAELQKMIDVTYNFKPSKLTAAEQSTKSAAMDAIWEKVKANQKELLPCLQAATESPTANNFFKFDASNLLLSLDSSDATKKLLIKAYADIDFNDIDLQYWMPYVARFGFEGFDVSTAGESWLKYPNPSYTLPQHGTLKVDKEIGALIIYGSMDEAVATPALLKIASQESNPAREIAVRVLMQQTTPEAFRELKKLNQKNLSEKTRQDINTLLTRPNILAKREGAPKITRQQYLDALQKLVDGKSDAFMDLAVKVTDGEKDAVAVLKQEDVPLVRKARRYFAATANPHSPEWYKSFTDILMALVWKPELLEQKS